MTTDPKALAEDEYAEIELNWPKPERVVLGKVVTEERLAELLKAEADLAALRASSSAEAIRERCAKLCEDRADYFDNAPGRRDWKDAARSYRATAEELRGLRIPNPGSAPVEGWRERVRHVKRGTEYEVLHRGVELQISVSLSNSVSPLTGEEDGAPEYVLCEGDRLVIYQGSDGKLWAREEGEFDDGRFQTLPPPPAEPSRDAPGRRGAMSGLAR